MAIDDATVEFLLKQAEGQHAAHVDPHRPGAHLEQDPGRQGGARSKLPAPIIGSGPFQTIEVKKGSYIRFVANKDYWKGAPKVDEVILEIYTNQDTMAMDLKSGSHRRRGRPAGAQFDAMKNEPGITASRPSSEYFVELALNVYDSDDSQANPVLRTSSSARRSAGRSTSRRSSTRPSAATERSASPSSCRSPTTPGRRRRSRRSATTWRRPPSCSTRPATRTGRRRHPRGQAGQADRAAPLDPE